jgi:hypothetical protein
VRTDLADRGDVALAIDRERVVLLRGQRQRVWDLTIPPAISPHHRLLLAAPAGDEDRHDHDDAPPWPDADARRAAP